MEKTKQTTNNYVNITGRVIDNFEFSHMVYGEGFYRTYIEVTRLSSAVDIIPVMISDRLVNTNSNISGRQVKVIGDYRSYNNHNGNNHKLELFVFATGFEVVDEEEPSENKIYLEGYLCKEPVYRLTPTGREISDVMLAVNNQRTGKSNYIPCILWGRNARFLKNLEIGDKLKLTGRVQSRKYIKKYNEEEMDEKIAYEISVNKVMEIQDQE